MPSFLNVFMKFIASGMLNFEFSTLAALSMLFGLKPLNASKFSLFTLLKPLSPSSKF